MTTQELKQINKEELEKLLSGAKSFCDFFAKNNLNDSQNNYKILNKKVLEFGIIFNKENKEIKIDEYLLRDCVNKSHNMSELIRNIGHNSLSSVHYYKLKNLIKKFNIDISHFDRKLHNSKKPYKLKLEDILVENSECFSTYQLKKKLINNNILENKCKICGINEWHGQKLVLVLDHINGIHNDNRIENLRFLCPNCNSLTDTFCGKNKVKSEKFCKECNKKLENTFHNNYCSNECRDIYLSRLKEKYCNKPKKEKVKSKPKIKEKKYCKKCGKEITGVGKIYCSYDCTHLDYRRVKRPSLEQLEEDLKTKPMLSIGKKYGVSDNAVRKWLRQKSS